MNNYSQTTDEFCFAYVRYPKKFSWKAFKKFGWVKGQILCEKYDITLTDHLTRKEKYDKGFDKAVSTLKSTAIKIIKSEGKPVQIFPEQKPRRLRITSKEPDFAKLNKELLGKKRKIWR